METERSESTPQEQNTISGVALTVEETAALKFDRDASKNVVENNIHDVKTVEQPQQHLVIENSNPKPIVNTTDGTQVVKKKRKKGKKIKRSEDYPKFYRNAYVRYCEEVRAKVCEEHPSLDPVEITKLVAAKWLSLDKEQKKPFLDEAQLDKDRYDRELKEYQAQNKSNEQVENVENNEPPKKKSKKKHKNDKNNQNEKASLSSSEKVEPCQPSASTTVVTSNANRDEIPKAFFTSNCELPIFTDAFLEHNKIIEAELKTLRKNNIEIEQQNSVLMKHIENMDNGVRKVEAEIVENKQRISQLEVYLIKLRVKLSAHFHSHSQPGWKNGATVENVDKYFQDLAMEAQKHSNSSPPSYIAKARDILKKVDLKIH